MRVFTQLPSTSEKPVYAETRPYRDERRNFFTDQRKYMAARRQIRLVHNSINYRVYTHTHSHALIRVVVNSE